MEALKAARARGTHAQEAEESTPQSLVNVLAKHISGLLGPVLLRAVQPQTSAHMASADEHALSAWGGGGAGSRSGGGGAPAFEGVSTPTSSPPTCKTSSHRTCSTGDAAEEEEEAKRRGEGGGGGVRRDGHVSAAGWLLIGAVMRRMHVRPRTPIRVLILLCVSSY
jgi:hypothetical protein